MGVINDNISKFRLVYTSAKMQVRVKIKLFSASLEEENASFQPYAG